MKNVLVALLVIVVLLVGFIATRPSTYHVERSMSMSAPPATTYALISDFHRWGGWSPWDKIDPAMKKEYGGAEAGSGATYHWVGNAKVGEGRMTITKATARSDVDIKLEFLKPYTATCDTKFAIAPEGAGSRVTWSMDGNANFMAKATSVFLGPMDKMIGPDFEKGLTSMKGLAESAPAAAADSSVAPTKS